VELEAKDGHWVDLMGWGFCNFSNTRLDGSRHQPAQSHAELTGSALSGLSDLEGELSRHAIFFDCPLCNGPMMPEHAHYRCWTCGFRDSCCD
jgi:hypothetical protein